MSKSAREGGRGERPDEAIALTTPTPGLAPGPEPERSLAGGRYRVGPFLGRGSSKQVFRGRDTELERDVAISFIGRVAGAAAHTRYQREVRAMAQVGDHPNIVAIYDVGREDGLTYIVSQHAPGGALGDLVRGRPGSRLDVPRALAVARDVAAALAHAHARGVVHRDVKPSNVLLGERGVAMLADFGVALALEDLRITAEHTHIGTALYMAPEQARGHPADARSDLYSLGVMLFELLCGEPPFTGPDTLAILAQHAAAPRPSVAARNPAVGPQLDALVARLMAADPADRPRSAGDLLEQLDSLSPDRPAPPPPARPVEAVRLPPALAGGRQADFVGRSDTLAALRATWRRARAGEPGVVLVRGEAGIGKTRLCARFAHEAHADGGTVLYGRCDEEPLAPYGPFTEVLRHFAAHQPGLPEQLQLPSDRHQLFEAAVALVETMAGHAPLLVIIDDLHWADMPTLRMLRHLVRHVANGPVLLVCTRRDDEPPAGDPRATALEEIRREPVVETLDVAGLSDEETAALVLACRRSPAASDVVRGLRERTAGNPFYIEETLHNVADLADLRTDALQSGLVPHTVPSGIEALIGRRLERLDPRTRELLGAAAVAGGEFGVDLLAALVEQSPVAVSDALEEAIRDGIVVEVPGRVDRFAFRHALVREALYAGQPPSRRMELHARCGTALEASGALAAELAHHFYVARHAGHAEQALRYSLEAAQDAAAAFAHEEAVAHKDRALQILAAAGPGHEVERCDLLLSRGRALWRAGEAESAQQTFQSAAELARRLDDAERFASAALGFGRRYYDPGGAQSQGVALLEEALGRLGERDSGSRARVLAGLAEALHFREPPERLQELGRNAVAMARRLGDDDALVVALLSLHNALLHTAFLPERLPIGVELLRLVDGRPGEHGATALHWRLYDLYEAGEMAAARREQVRLNELAERLRQPLYRHFAAAWEATQMKTAGRFERAEQLAQRSSEFARRAHMSYAESNYFGQRFGLLREQGRLDALRDDAARHIGDPPTLPVWRAGMILAHLDAGDRTRARADFDTLAADGFGAVPPDLFWLAAMCLLAEACSRLADAPRAPDLYERLLPYGDRNAQIALAVSVGVVHRFLGLLAALTLRWPEAERHFEAAIERSAAFDAVTTLAHIRCDYAAMLLARAAPGDRDRATSQAARARTVAEQLGIERLARRAAILQG